MQLKNIPAKHMNRILQCKAKRQYLLTLQVSTKHMSRIAAFLVKPQLMKVTSGNVCLEMSSHKYISTILPCKAKRQYLLTLYMNRYWILALQSSIVPMKKSDRIYSQPNAVSIMDEGVWRRGGGGGVTIHRWSWYCWVKVNFNCVSEF